MIPRKIQSTQLAWGLRNISSLITRRSEVVIHAQPGEYTPETSRLIRLHISDASSCVLLSTARFVCEIHNTHATAPLELITQGQGLFSQTRLLSQGTIVDQIDFAPQLAELLKCTLPQDVMELKGQEY